MKRFKKVLALVLAGVLALAMLTACDGGTTDPDKIMPDDGTVEVVMTINNTAANKGLGPGRIQCKIQCCDQGIARKTGWNGVMTAAIQSIVRIMIRSRQSWAMSRSWLVWTKDTTPLAAQANYNPATRTSFKYDSIVADSSTYNLAEKVGVAFVKTQNGTVYQLVCLFDVN